MNLNHVRTRRQKTLDSLLHFGPNHFDMGIWYSKPDPDFDNQRLELELSQVGPLKGCGTAACLAGHAVSANRSLRNTLQAYKPWDDDSPAKVAAEYLGLFDHGTYGSNQSWADGTRLFYAYQWPRWMNALRSEFPKGERNYWVAVSVMRWLTQHPEVDRLPTKLPEDFVPETP